MVFSLSNSTPSPHPLDPPPSRPNITRPSSYAKDAAAFPRALDTTGLPSRGAVIAGLHSTMPSVVGAPSSPLVAIVDSKSLGKEPVEGG